MKFKTNFFSLLLIIIIMLSGYFSIFVKYFIIIVIHEFGHIAKIYLFKRKVISIEILPMGFIIKDNSLINSSILVDFIISSMGIINQLILLLFLDNQELININ